MDNISMSAGRLSYYKAIFYSGSVFNVIGALVFFFGFDFISSVLGVTSIPETPLLTMYVKFFAKVTWQHAVLMAVDFLYALFFLEYILFFRKSQP